jgi:hypothetical protein
MKPTDEPSEERLLDRAVEDIKTSLEPCIARVCWDAERSPPPRQPQLHERCRDEEHWRRNSREHELSDKPAGRQAEPGRAPADLDDSDDERERRQTAK